MANTEKNRFFIFTISILFILLYGSGFVGAKLGFAYAKPLVFLTLRFAISALLLLLIALIVKAKWPSWREAFHIGVAGLFLVSLFSIGTWVSMDLGVPPAVSALIIALQPLSVAIASHFVLKKSVNASQWMGLALGLLGVALVVSKNTSFNMTYLTGIFMSFLGLLGLTIGNLYQKKFCSNMNIFTGGIIQSLASGIVCAVGALLFEPLTVHWTGQFMFALFWMSVVISIGAISFLYILISQGESHKVASLFYLVPVATAIIAYLVFKTMLSPIELAGMLIAVLGVGLVNVKLPFKNKSLKTVSKESN